MQNHRETQSAGSEKKAMQTRSDYGALKSPSQSSTKTTKKGKKRNDGII